MKRNKKPLLIGALAVLLVALVVGGTIAWLTADDQKVNEFTVGTFGEPTEKPDDDDPGTNDDEDENESGNPTTDLDGFLFETLWTDDEHKLMEGVAEPKNPNVGVAKENSDDPYVFIYVENNAVKDGKGNQNYASLAPYFTIQKQWAPVTDDSDLTPTATTATSVTDKTNVYVDGLFMYVGDEEHADNLPNVLNLAAQEFASQDNVYTGELFESITIPQGIDTNELVLEDGNVTVHAYIYASTETPSDGTDPNPEEGTARAAVDAAIAWAKGLN